MNRTNIYLPLPTIERLREMSEKTGLSVAEIIRRAVDAYLISLP
jgi:predicted DNA-binding protein